MRQFGKLTSECLDTMHTNDPVNYFALRPLLGKPYLYFNIRWIGHQCESGCHWHGISVQ